MLDVQRVLFDQWGGYRVPEQPIFPSNIGDDHSPYEYSLALEKNDIELRILYEAQSSTPDYASNLASARACNARIRERYAPDFSRYDAVEDLFLPSESSAAFGLWHAACFTRSSEPAFKVYLNPAVHGQAHAWDTVREALRRLGFASQTHELLSRVAFRGTEDELKYFSVDLAGGPKARVKVYFAHHHARVATLEQAFALAPTHRAGDVREFCSRILGDQGPFLRKPLTSCFSFVSGTSAPLAVTLHVPVAHYVEDDQLVARRVFGYLGYQGLGARAYMNALSAFAPRPLGNGPGIQSYASFRRLPTGMRTTMYLSPELFDSGLSRSRVSRRVT